VARLRQLGTEGETCITGAIQVDDAGLDLYPMIVKRNNKLEFDRCPRSCSVGSAESRDSAEPVKCQGVRRVATGYCRVVDAKGTGSLKNEW
jgi:hypothetical protein